MHHVRPEGRTLRHRPGHCVNVVAGAGKEIKDKTERWTDDTGKTTAGKVERWWRWWW